MDETDGAEIVKYSAVIPVYNSDQIVGALLMSVWISLSAMACPMN